MVARILFLCLILTLKLSVNGAVTSEFETPYFESLQEHVRFESDVIYIAEDVDFDEILGELKYTGNDRLYITYDYKDDFFPRDEHLFEFNETDRTLILKKKVDMDDGTIDANFMWPNARFQFVEDPSLCSREICKIPRIIYEDVNDRYPPAPTKTPDQQTFYVPENTIPEDILTISATDNENYADDMSMSIKLTGGDDIFKFNTVGLNEWNLTIERELNFETTRVYQLEINIWDHPDRYGKTFSFGPIPIMIRVTDEPDVPPDWQKYCTSATIQEQNEINTELFTVSAWDPDIGINNQIEYEIVNITDSLDITHTFATIDNNGKVTMTETIDRESDEYKDLGASMSFVVRIRPKEVDPQNCGGSDISPNCVGEVMDCYLQIEDIDDNPPIFKEDENVYIKTLDELVGRMDIFSLLMSDADLSPFDRFTVDIVDTNNPPLDLEVTPKTANGHPNRTIIISTTETTKNALDYESIGTHQVKFTLKLTGVDDHSKTASEEFTIDITDMNDNPPEFNQKNYTINIKEDLTNLNEPVDGIIDLEMEVAATDLDDNDLFGNSSLRYFISNSTEIERWLVLNATTGKLTMDTTYARPPSDYIDIDVEGRESQHTLAIEVWDCLDDSSTCSGFGVKLRNKITAIISIFIEDVNDEMPTLQQSPMGDLCVKENGSPLPCGIGINLINATFTAVDKDSMAQLELEIDWTKSSATKNGDPVEGYDWKETLLLKHQPNQTGKKIAATLKNNPGKLLDFEMVDKLDLRIYANDQDTMNQTVEQNVIVNVDDANDNPPTLDGEEVFGVIDSTKDRDSIVLPISPINATDVDFVDGYGSALEFSIVRTDTSNAINVVDIEDPFSIKKVGNQANIILNFSPQENIAGYFILELQVKDTANHTQNKNYSIIVTTPRNECYFTFNEELAIVERKVHQVTEIFSRVFSNTSREDWLFQEIKLEPIGDEQTRATQQTRVTSYFIKDRQQEVLRPRVEGAYMYSLITLVQELHAIGLHLDSSHGMGKPDENNSEWNETSNYAVLGSLFGAATFLLIALFATYWIRTSNLERKVKALGIEVDDERTTKTKKPDKIILAGLQENFPGSNEFAESGANPIWQVAMESTDFEENFKMDDTASESSGDSILIGVEDQRDFSTLEEVDIDVDMDLYANLNKRRMAPSDEGQDLDDIPEWSRGRLDDPPEDDSSEIYTISRPGNPLAGGNPLYADSDDEEDI